MILSLIIVVLFGKSFYQSDLVSCKFSDRILKSYFVSPNTIECAIPAAFVGQISIFLSLDGINVINTGFNFEFVTVAQIMTPSPILGSSSGGTHITLMGSRFYERDGFHNFN